MNLETISDILVFKTNIHDTIDLQKAARVLDQDARIRRWNIDAADIDRVLRVESTHLEPAQVIMLMQGIGFMCEELPD